MHMRSFGKMTAIIVGIIILVPVGFAPAAHKNAGLYIDSKAFETVQETLEVEQYAPTGEDGAYEWSQTLRLDTSVNHVRGDTALEFISDEDGARLTVCLLCDLNGDGRYEYTAQEIDIYATSETGQQQDKTIQKGDGFLIQPSHLLRLGKKMQAQWISGETPLPDIRVRGAQDMVFYFRFYLPSKQAPHLYFVRIDLDTIDQTGRDALGAAQFTDLMPWDDAWYAIDYCVTQELLSGTGANTFSPQNGVSRGMLCQVLYHMQGKPTIKTHEFSDVKKDDWFYSGVMWCYDKGVVGGTTAGDFAPQQMLTREQMAQILFRYVSLSSVSTGADGFIQQFEDGQAVSIWAQEGVQWAISRGILTGQESGLLNPQGMVSRAELAQALMILHKETR